MSLRAITTFLHYLQGWYLQYFSGQPVPIPNHLFHGEILLVSDLQSSSGTTWGHFHISLHAPFILISFKPPWRRLRPGWIGQSDLVLDILACNPACGSRVGWSLRSLPNQAILWFCDDQLSICWVLCTYKTTVFFCISVQKRCLYKNV